MPYAVVYDPEIDQTRINHFRTKYDPHVDLIRPHITLVFPLPKSVGFENLSKHIKAIVVGLPKFKLHLTGLSKSWDHWLFLLVKEGNDDLIRLHDKLYSGMLQPYLRKDIEYQPHVGLGLFTKRDFKYRVEDPQKGPLDEDAFVKALTEAENSQFDYWSEVDHVSVIQIDDSFSKIIDTKEFCLR